jgi:hypothetical protein
MTIYLSLLVCLIGMLVYAFTVGKVATLALIAYGCGLLAFLLQLGNAHFGVLPR